jgi:hypothetical protein
MEIQKIVDAYADHLEYRKISVLEYMLFGVNKIPEFYLPYDKEMVSGALSLYAKLSSSHKQAVDFSSLSLDLYVDEATAREEFLKNIKILANDEEKINQYFDLVKESELKKRNK